MRQPSTPRLGALQFEAPSTSPPARLGSSRSVLAATATTTWDVSRPRDGRVTSIAFDPRNPSVVYATYGNFGGRHVYRSADGGATWTATDGDPSGRKRLFVFTHGRGVWRVDLR